ncbi:hypothetical protein [Marinobacter xestospongiae]|uniref:hypothetical protein n=1 Tax=Marinobacter xestospongiae TaxID=994319 RepID=UPI002003D9A4|nr:hypothetical protein [Marinobacter xestospongiae]MCK7566608.1 hypothetical protein [Marinobacter xestospongiae]
MNMQRLRQILALGPDEALMPYCRQVGADWPKASDTLSYRQVSADGDTVAVIDAWQVDGICLGFVRYDASGFVFRDRGFVSLDEEDGDAAYPVPRSVVHPVVQAT